MRKYIGFGSYASTSDEHEQQPPVPAKAVDHVQDHSSNTAYGTYTSYLPSLGTVGGWLWRAETSSSADNTTEMTHATTVAEGHSDTTTQTHGHKHSHGHGHGHHHVRNLLRKVKSGDDNNETHDETTDAHHHHHHHHHHPHLHVKSLLKRAWSGEEPDDATSLQLMKQSVLELVGPVSSSKDIILVKPSPDEKRDRLVEQLCMSEAERLRIIRQFLRARHGDPRAAAEMLKQTLLWRQRVDIETYLTNKHLYLSGCESFMPIFILSNHIDCKQPLVYALPRMYDKKKVNKDALHNAVLSFFETLYYENIYASDQIMAIMDFRGWSIRKHAPYRAVKEGISLLQAHYPDRLGRIFLVNYPTTLRAAYTVVSPIIDGAAKEKIIWVAEDVERTLARYLGPKSIPTWLGGELQASIPGVDMAEEWRTGKVA